MSDAPPGRMRLDKWLWCSRFFKTRALAARFCEERGVRVDGVLVLKAHYTVKPGDVLTFAPRDVVVLRVLRLPARRGPATEARGCYEHLDGGSIDCGGATA